MTTREKKTLFTTTRQTSSEGVSEFTKTTKFVNEPIINLSLVNLVLQTLVFGFVLKGEVGLG